MEFLNQINFSFFYAGAFIAGLSSFAHCFFMCGPVHLLFRKNSYSYQTGRIAGYTFVGGMLGFAGPLLDRAGILVSVQNFSIYAAVALLLVYASVFLFNIKIKTPKFFKKLSSWIVKIKQNSKIPSSVSTALAGILSALIPCSVLYPVWILSATSGSVFSGSIMAFSFVMGTVPALLLFQILSGQEKRIDIFQNKIFRNVSTILILVISVFVLFHRHLNAPFPGQNISPSEEICE
ncbi:MAG: sulfite exporter TauE/SafE family protein [Spirochaetia bacterium]|nr:sulfite exporter TauE/SafE family protein [Spirochaetia bacterium]